MARVAGRHSLTETVSLGACSVGYLQTAVVPMMLQLYDLPRETGVNFAGIPPLKYKVHCPPGTPLKFAVPPPKDLRNR